MDDIRIVHTQKEDIENIFCLFRRTMELQGKNGYKFGKIIGRFHFQICFYSFYSSNHKWAIGLWSIALLSLSSRMNVLQAKTIPRKEQ